MPQPTIFATIIIENGLQTNLPTSGFVGEPFFATDTGNFYVWNGSSMALISGGGGGAFSGVTAGTNTHALVMGTGGSLSVSGSGTIAATSVTGLSIASGKTHTVNNSLTFAGTDGTTMTFPGTSDTVVTLGATQTLTNKTLTSPTLTTPALGTPASGNLANCTLPSATNSALGAIELNTDLGGIATAPQVVSTHLASALPVNQGGTGTTSPALVAGTGINITGSFPNQTVATTTVPIQSIVSSGLIGRYQFDEGSGTTLTDYSGSGNNGTLGSSGAAPTWVGNPNGGLSFAGGQYVSLPSGINSGKTFQIFCLYNQTSNSNATNALLYGTNGTNYAGVAFYVGANDAWGEGYQGTTPGNARIRSFGAPGGNVTKNSSRSVFNGTNLFTFLQDTDDRFIINTSEVDYIQNPYSSAGLMTAGNYQLGGISGNYLTGTIYYMLVYNRVLTNAEVAQNYNYIAAVMANRGVAQTIYNLTDTTDQLVLDGDSITTYLATYATTFPVANSGNPLSVTNQGKGGQGLNSMYATANTCDYPCYRPAAARNTMVIWAGTNISGTPAQMWAQMSTMARGAKAVGFKVVLVTMQSRGGEDGTKNALNFFIRQGWKTCADALADIAANPNVGADGASSNTTYFLGDGIHPTSLTATTIHAPIISAAVNRCYIIDEAYPTTVTQPTQGQRLQQTINTTATVNNAQVTAMPSNVTAGSMLFLFCNGVPNSVTDTQFNTWTKITNISGSTAAIWYALNCNPGPTTISMNYSSGTTPTAVFAEYTQVSNVAFDVDVTSNTTSTTWAPGAITTTQNNDLVILCIFNITTAAPSVTPSSGLTTVYAQSYMCMADGLAASSGSTTPSFTGPSLHWYGASVAFKTPASQAYQLAPYDKFAYVDPTSASATVNLPDAIGMTGQIVTIKNVQTSGANTVTVQGISSETIDGSSSITVANKAAAKVQSKLTSPSAAGANWVQVQ